MGSLDALLGKDRLPMPGLPLRELEDRPAVEGKHVTVTPTSPIAAPAVRFSFRGRSSPDSEMVTPFMMGGLPLGGPRQLSIEI
eukprot:m.347531 g.347531  ORF g.347531 m.347531 type:complete len:83 (-) comp27925_c0_seq2:218-466(-)